MPPRLPTPTQLLLVPCFTAPPNTTIDTSVDKAIAIVGSPTNDEWDGIAVNAFVGDTTLPYTTGFKQVASMDGTTFYVAGNGASRSGFRYVSSVTSDAAAPVVGQVAGEPGYTDARGVGLYGGSLYGTSGDAGYTAVFNIGGAGTLPVAHTR